MITDELLQNVHINVIKLNNMFDLREENKILETTFHSVQKPFSNVLQSTSDFISKNV